MTYPWASLKPALYYFYVHKNLTLDEVRKKIEAKYGIVIQNRTYRQKFQEWGFRKSDHKEWRSRTRSRSCERTVGARNAPKKNSPPPRLATAAHPHGRAGRGALLNPGGKPLRRVGSKSPNRPSPSNSQVGMSDDLDAMHEDLGWNVEMSVEELSTNAEFQDTTETIEDGQAVTDTTPSLIKRSLRALVSSPQNARGFQTEAQASTPVHSERSLFIPFSHPTVMHASPSSSALPLRPLPICDGCAVRINTPYTVGEVFVKCAQVGCLYRGLDDMRVPSLSHNQSQSLTTPSYLGGMQCPDLGRQVEDHSYATAQTLLSGYSSSCPPFLQTTSHEEMEPVDLVPYPPFEKSVFHPPLEDLQSHERDASSMSSMGPVDHPRHFPLDLPSPHSSLSRQDSLPHYTEAWSLSHLASQPSAFPYMQENFTFSLQNIQAHCTDSHIVPPCHYDSLQRGYPNTIEAMDTNTAHDYPYPHLPHHMSEAQAMTAGTPQPGSYAVPWQNGFEFQDPIMTTSAHGFGTLSHENNNTEHDQTRLAMLDASPESTAKHC